MTDWSTVLLSGVSAGLVSTGCTFGFGWLRDRSQRGRDASYAAVRATIALEAFVVGCLHIVYVDDINGIDVRPTSAGKLPLLAEFPSNVDWRSFPLRLTEKVLGFPNLIDAGQARMERADWESGDLYRGPVEAAILGAEAWRLAVEIRSEMKLGVNRELAAAGDELCKRAKRYDEHMAQFRGGSETQPVAI